MDFNVSLSVVIGSIIALAGGILSIQKIMINSKKIKEEQVQKILAMAREEINLTKSKLESRIEATKAELKNLELSITKDISHIKDNHDSEIHMLSEKIETLRQELSTQHASMVGLLSKLIDKD